MSAFGKYGTGGTNPGKYPGEPDTKDFDFATAAQGTESNTPDSKPEVTAGMFGAPEHNPAGGLKTR